MAGRVHERAAGRGGRPSKGTRDPLICRVPRDLADVVKDEAEAGGVTVNDFIAAVLAARVGYDLPLTYSRPTGRDHSIQEEIPMQNAS